MPHAKYQPVDSTGPKGIGCRRRSPVPRQVVRISDARDHAEVTAAERTPLQKHCVNFPSGAGTESDLLNRCIGELYTLANSDWHEEEGYAHVEGRLIKVIQAVAPAQAWAEFRSKLAGAVRRTEDDEVADSFFFAASMASRYICRPPSLDISPT